MLARRMLVPWEQRMLALRMLVPWEQRMPVQQAWVQQQARVPWAHWVRRVVLVQRRTTCFHAVRRRAHSPSEKFMVPRRDLFRLEKRMARCTCRRAAAMSHVRAMR